MNFINIFFYKIQLKILYNCNLKAERGIFDSYGNKYYGITQDPITKDFIIIMDKYILMLDDLKYITDQLLYKSGNNVVDDFIRCTQNIQSLDLVPYEFVPYYQFKDIEFICEDGFGKTYKATWINGYILNWDHKELNFKRSGPTVVSLKMLDKSENITSRELNEVQIFI